MNGLKRKVNSVKKYCKDHKTQIILIGGIVGYSALWYMAGRKIGYLKGVKEGITIGANADVDFIRTYVPEAARLVETFVKVHPETLAKNDAEFVKGVMKTYL